MKFFFRLGISACALSAVMALFSTPARANGRIPAGNQIVLSPERPARILLRTTFGLALSNDRGKTWHWVCESAMLYGGSQDPMYGTLEDGTIAAAVLEGITVSHDDACTFGLAAGDPAGKFFFDLAVRGDNRKSAVAMSGGFVGTTDAGQSTYESYVFETNDNARSWKTLGTALDPAIAFETIEVAKGSPDRLYVSGARTNPPDPEGKSKRDGFVFVSKDHGVTWTSHSIPLFGDERSPYVSGVDPNRPDRIYLRVAGAPDVPSRLLLSDDAGETYREIAKTTTSMLGFALSEDGSRIYIGSVGDGLMVANTTDFAWNKTSKVPIQCLATMGGELYACSNDASGFVVGRTPNEGQSFEPLLRLATLKGPLACAPGTPTNKCESEWPALRDLLGAGGTTRPDAGAIAPSAGPVAGGGCSETGARGPLAAFAGFAVAVLGLARLRTRLFRGSR